MNGHTHTTADRPFPGSLTRETFDDAMEYSVARKTFPFHWCVRRWTKPSGLTLGPRLSYCFGWMQTDGARTALAR